MLVLRDEERRLDELIQACTNNVQQMTEEMHNQKYPLHSSILIRLQCKIVQEYNTARHAYISK